MRTLLLILVILSSSGCSLLRSRYAMDDPIYARKYAVGASKQDIAGKIKQAFDARHTKFLEGWLVSGGAQVRPRSGETFGSIEVGKEMYLENYFTSRVSLAGFASNDVASLGVDVGARLQAPSRLAPFLGAGATAGLLAQDAIPLAVGVAFDRDDTFDDLGQEPRSIDGLAAIYPEAGVHFWLDGHIRFTAFGRYLLTTQGRDFDDWLVGGQIAIFNR